MSETTTGHPCTAPGCELPAAYEVFGQQEREHRWAKRRVHDSCLSHLHETVAQLLTFRCAEVIIRPCLRAIDAP